MLNVILEFAIIGGIAGLLLSFVFASGKIKKNSRGDQIMEKEISKQNAFSRWSVKLAILGLILGVFTTLSMGYTNIGFMIGFGLPLALLLGAVGLFIDLVISRKN